MDWLSHVHPVHTCIMPATVFHTTIHLTLYLQYTAQTPRFQLMTAIIVNTMLLAYYFMKSKPKKATQPIIHYTRCSHCVPHV